MEPASIQPDQEPAAQIEQEVHVRIVQHEDHGFYWTVSVDEDGNFVPAGEEQNLIGPFDTHDEAFASARAFVEDAIQENQETDQ